LRALAAREASVADAAAFLIAYAAKASLVLTIVAVGARLLTRAAAATRHWMWLTATAAVLVLPIAMTVAPRVAVRMPSVPDVPAVQALLAPPVVQPVARPATQAVPGSRAQATRNAQSETERRSRAGAIAGDASTSVLAIAIWMWATIALVIGGRVLLDVRRAHRLASSARVVSEPEVASLVREFAGASNARRVRVLASDRVAAPMTAGIASRAILLPADHDRWAPGERRAILAHEVAHALRRDCATHIAARFMCAIHWFNPLAWYAARALRVEAERACDDCVLRAGTQAIAYAELLVRFARTAIGGVYARAALPMATRGRELEGRVAAIVDSGVHRGSMRRVTRVAVATFAAGALVAAASARLEAAKRDEVAVSPQPIARAATTRGAPAPTQIHSPGREVATVPGPIAAPADTLADPRSERIPLSDETVAAARAARATLIGPDSTLARMLFDALDRAPLHDGDLVSERATWALAHARGNQLTEPLIDALSSRDWREAAYAAWALTRVPDVRALSPLIALLEHGAWRARAAAASALATMADARAAAAMQVALSDETWQVRAEAVSYFGALGDAASLDAIRGAVNDPHVAVRSAAESALTPRRDR
jgi:beta-lactamase regulating signal transducer with metallopeptidase domain